MLTHNMNEVTHNDKPKAAFYQFSDCFFGFITDNFTVLVHSPCPYEHCSICSMQLL